MNGREVLNESLIVCAVISDLIVGFIIGILVVVLLGAGGKDK